MHKHIPTALLVTALAGALAFALAPAGAASPASSTAALATAVSEPLPGRNAEAPPLGAIDETQPLPPGHPAIGAAGSDERAQSLTWSAPASFQEAPNPSTMRLATYRVARAPGDAEETDLSVVQAGGSTDANIERWLGQFDDAGKESRAVRTIAGVKVTVVEVRGTYQGGGMTMGSTSGAPTAHPHWALLAAIVEVPGAPYFFKMVGPEKSVAAARAGFDALLSSMRVTEAAGAVRTPARGGL